ncbi:hypothetical protein A3H80_00355 [Candidatus Roizmanbacteria bacterium RIFCSPLOWO2_02_FULL_37_19]|uniref:Glycosyltransferase 2-like domain-containing protein n=1 Tax=Candidatus Roizmanbacteria bacterium RIFCSPHIGHO2_02_FULL_37_24 TaxID=1802037 RepID=A0A1F7H0G1_9BACT|nr:MAG: hypothetical protein A2862_04835 [Candidatus Roizmanbacteria bacterium RIFCSPHIGHO2_01_FULL_38_41]OGK24444.1 MAG: hypothetical protein A3C24_02065 [Candidatus Roizmanbacteria bacterium RIFCSPHIGHO2_02_FULL_37_24]OGK32658.1 MAG: hypothetical protein A3E10_01535 [Candidatus Roizmanbacteria bacterium RIFCSPHIGHO2_12_FULL_37_23]OGK44776.1 MAG: hypothetical protein A2956_01615 [Candidatus Roizmanbacteria bacterium RIFCSPLOWO2_01_FULL_37_57]OGK53972.1 MAG: hypothetical protein A3H80_00355 [Ca
MLSAVIIAKNEEKNIQNAIESVSFCDEVVVVDNESIDKTSEIAIKAGAKVYRDGEADFSKIRNFAMGKTKGDWILFIDADERIPKRLSYEVLKQASSDVIGVQDDSMQADRTEVFRIKRRDFFWGTELRFGETQQVRKKGMIRLIKKNSGTWKGKVHEEFHTDKPVGQLQSFIDHYPHPTVAEFLQSVNQYSTLRAQELFEKNYNSSFVQIMLYPIGKFIYTYIILLGILDGAAGFVYSFMMSFHSFLVRSKLYLLAISPSRK